MRTPKLYASHIHSTGRMDWPDDWHDYHPIARADALADWITEMQQAWLEAVDQIGPKKVQRQLGYWMHLGPLQ